MNQFTIQSLLWQYMLSIPISLMLLSPLWAVMKVGDGDLRFSGDFGSILTVERVEGQWDSTIAWFSMSCLHHVGFSRRPRSCHSFNVGAASYSPRLGSNILLQYIWIVLTALERLLVLGVWFNSFAWSSRFPSVQNHVFPELAVVTPALRCWLSNSIYRMYCMHPHHTVPNYSSSAKFSIRSRVVNNYN